MPRNKGFQNPAPYSDHDKNVVLRLWEQGLSASQIAAEISTSSIPRSRNSVISLVHRNGGQPRLVVSRKPTGKAAREAAADRRAALALSDNERVELRNREDGQMGRQFRKGSASHRTGYSTGTHNTKPKVIEITEESDTSIAQLEASPDQCQWPASTDVRDMRVCGKPVECGAYCMHHASLAYRAAPTRKRQRAFHRREQFYN